MVKNEKQFTGMTVNERLFDIGKLEEYNRALAEKDISKIRILLESVFVDEPSIDRTVDDVKSGLLP